MRANLFDVFKKKRNEVLTLIRKSKNIYFQNFFESNKSDIKKTWQGIKNIVNINKKQNILPTKLQYNNKVYDKDSDIADNFNTFFTNIGNSVEEKMPKASIHFTDFLKNKSEHTLFRKPVCESKVSDMIRNLNSSKSCGPSSVPSNLLKTFSSFFAKPLAMLINLSLEEGSFPSLLKLASICPIFKKNYKNKCENYRPISLLSNLSKLF